ncbi:GSFK dehydrogenase, partial [Pomatorhinus ruficollis]|nr:GSFK dehydrogenase [Pomatorhinus ruficollis]
SNMGELCVRSVLVTGANRGLGLGFVQHFLRMPNPPQWIFATCRDPKGQRAQVRPGWEAVAVRGYGSSWSRGWEHLVPGGDWNRDGVCKELQLQLGTHGPGQLGWYTVGAAAFLPLLKKAAQGSPGSGLSCSKAAIVNISSIGGSIASSFGWDMMQLVSYRCSKAALNMLSKCQSLAYKEHGILCVALHPGWVQTDLGSSAGHTPPVTVDDSVQGMLKVISSLSEKDTGAFLDWEGKVIPW